MARPAGAQPPRGPHRTQAGPRPTPCRRTRHGGCAATRPSPRQCVGTDTSRLSDNNATRPRPNTGGARCGRGTVRPGAGPPRVRCHVTAAHAPGRAELACAAHDERKARPTAPAAAPGGRTALRRPAINIWARPAAGRWPAGPGAAASRPRLHTMARSAEGRRSAGRDWTVRAVDGHQRPADGVVAPGAARRERSHRPGTDDTAGTQTDAQWTDGSHRTLNGYEIRK